MAVVQFSWQDESDNETSFKVYKGTSTPLDSNSTQIAKVELTAGVWSASEFASGTAPSIQLTSTNTGNSTTTQETFVITYEESTAGTYYSGVSASNAIGDSDVLTSSALTIS